MINNNDIEDMDDKGVMWEYYNSKPANHNKPTKESWLTMTPMDMVRVFSQMTGQPPDADLYEKLIQEEYEEWLAETFSAEDELKELADLVFVCYQYAVARNWNLDTALKRVFESNMSKFVDGKPLRREDGKILKGPNYQPPFLKDLL